MYYSIFKETIGGMLHMVNRNPEFCKIENALEVLQKVEYSITEYGKT